MGNFEKLGILVIIVLVVVILVLAVWGMGVPPDPQDGDHVLSGKAARAGNNAGGDAAKKDPKTVEIGKTSAGKDGLDHWLKPQDNASEPKVDQGKKLNEEPGSKKDTTSAGKDVEHTIVKGDSPWALAARYYGNGSRWTLIRDANPGIDMDNLSVGKVLKIPSAEQVAAKKTTSRDTTPVGKKTYTVKKNDTLSGIARRTMGSEDDWRKLYEANRTAIGSNPNSLRLGMELVIP